MQKFILAAIMIILGSCKENKDSQVAYDWKSKGDSIVTLTFDTLRNTLLKAIGEKGFPGAVDFCNTQALPLTATYATGGIFIKRTSDKLRNPANAPDETETKMLRYFQQRKIENKEPDPQTRKDDNGRIHYFKPILIQALCLNCHGDKANDISPETLQVIERKYPLDAAFNYKEGDLRGMWHIIFPNEKRK